MKTSYFGNLKKLNKNQIPIAICAKSPVWYSGLEFKILAPKYKFFMEWKDNHDNDAYVREFKRQVLGMLDANTIVSELFKLAGIDNELENEIVLVCYEKPGDFCHRNQVAGWLSDNGFPTSEI